MAAGDVEGAIRAANAEEAAVEHGIAAGIAQAAQEKAMAQKARGEAFVIRYVVTHFSKRLGYRTLAHPSQGQYTYATREEAQAWIDAAMKVNSMDRLKSLYDLPLETRAIKCWPGHFDPKSFCDFEPE